MIKSQLIQLIIIIKGIITLLFEDVGEKESILLLLCQQNKIFKFNNRFFTSSSSNKNKNKNKNNFKNNKNKNNFFNNKNNKIKLKDENYFWYGFPIVLLLLFLYNFNIVSLKTITSFYIILISAITVYFILDLLTILLFLSLKISIPSYMPNYIHTFFSQKTMLVNSETKIQKFFIDMGIKDILINLFTLLCLFLINYVFC